MGVGWQFVCATELLHGLDRNLAACDLTGMGSGCPLDCGAESRAVTATLRVLSRPHPGLARPPFLSWLLHRRRSEEMPHLTAIR